MKAAMQRADVPQVKEVPPWKNALLLALVVCFASGCTTLRPISPESKVVNETLRPNDHIRVTKRDGRVLELTVKEITERTIMGDKGVEKTGHPIEQEWIAIADAVRIERYEYSHMKTAGLIVGLGLTAGLIFTLTIKCVGMC